MMKITDALSSIYRKAEAAAADLLSGRHFLFTVVDQPKGLFKVIHWEGTEGISSSYCYTLSLAANGVVDDVNMLSKEATLSIDREGEMRRIHGFVSEVTHLGSLASEHAEEYQVVIESPLAKLKFNHQSRVFLNQDIKDVLEKVLLDAGFTANSFHIDLKNVYPVRDCIVQYNETDFNFFTRLLEHSGIFYHFEQQDEQAFLAIQDDSATLSEMTGSAALIYQPLNEQVEDSEGVQALQSGQHFLTRSVKSKKHHDSTPETSLLSEDVSNSKIPANMTCDVDGEHTATVAEREQTVRRHQEVIDWQRAIYLAETNCRGMTAGTTFSISGHPEDDHNGDYLVVSVRHQGDQSLAFVFGASYADSATAETYRNELTLIKKDIPYRTPVDLARRPVVFGVLNSTNEIPADEYAYENAQGNISSEPINDITILSRGGGPIQISQDGETIELFTGCDLMIDIKSVEISHLSAHIQRQQNGVA